MPFDLPLLTNLRNAGWKVKIREKESREPPHVTILWRTKAWRLDLRTGKFMDLQPDPSEVPESLMAHVRAEANWQTLCDAWDVKYPMNPVHEPDATAQE